MAHLHQGEHFVSSYLDDWLLMALSLAEVASAVAALQCLLTLLGISVNLEKSVLLPTQTIHFIGVHLGSIITQVFLAADSFTTLLALVRTLCRNCYYLLGHMTACTYMTPRVCLHMRCLQLWLLLVCRPHINPVASALGPPIHTSFTWWTNPTKVLRGTPFTTLIPMATLTMEVSLAGWGAHLVSQATQGRQTLRETCMHINTLELGAVH